MAEINSNRDASESPLFDIAIAAAAVFMGAGALKSLAKNSTKGAAKAVESGATNAAESAGKNAAESVSKNISPVVEAPAASTVEDTITSSVSSAEEAIKNETKSVAESIVSEAAPKVESSTMSLNDANVRSMEYQNPAWKEDPGGYEQLWKDLGPTRAERQDDLNSVFGKERSFIDKLTGRDLSKREDFYRLRDHLGSIKL